MTDRPVIQIALPEADLLALDGRCTPGTQAVVDAQKARNASIARMAMLTPRQAGFVVDVIEEARTKGILACAHAYVRKCRICEADAGYAIARRSSATARKGHPDFNKPLYLSGREYARRFVFMKGYPTLGCCTSCAALVEPLIASELAEVPTEVPVGFSGVEPYQPPPDTWGRVRAAQPRFRRHEIRRCKACGLVQHEGEMRRDPCLMGDGTWPSGCRGCGTTRGPFDSVSSYFDEIAGFVVVDPANTVVRTVGAFSLGEIRSAS